MNAVTAAQEILEIMLRHLGYTAEVTVDTSSDVPGLQVTVDDPKAASALTGQRGERLDDLQPLVNKLLRPKPADPPPVPVDGNPFPDRKDDPLPNDVRAPPDKGPRSGQAIK